MFNSLNSIYSLTVKKSNDAPEAVIMLSELMRYMLYKANDSKVLLKDEIQYIENYIKFIFGHTIIYIIMKNALLVSFLFVNFLQAQLVPIKIEDFINQHNSFEQNDAGEVNAINDSFENKIALTNIKT